MKKLIIILPVLFLIFTSCDTTDPKPPEEKPPGYQEDIPWPSLADSPWPMFRADPQNTGRSRHQIMNSNFSIASSINSSNLYAGIVLSPNSILFNTSNPSTIYSFNKYPVTKNWEELIGFETNTAPLVTNKNIITTAQNILYAFDYSGDTLWTRRVIGNYVNQRSLNIDKKGNIYLVNEQTIYQFTQDGKLLNKLSNSNISRWNTTAFSPDGTTLYLVGEEVSLVAFDVKSFSIKWTFGINNKALTPSVDSYGNIYFLTFSDEGNSKLFSINPEGALNWEFNFNDQLNFVSPPQVIGKHGNIYFGLDTLYSVSFDGKFKWKIEIQVKENIIYRSAISEITIDATENIIVGTWDNRVIMVSKDGTIEHEVQLVNGRGLLPVVISDDAIYAPLYKGEGETGDIFILR